MRGSNNRALVTLIGLVIVASSRVFAAGHTWDVNEMFSNANGTIQFIEVQEANGTPGETGTAGHAVTSNTRSFTITANVAPPTTFRHLLLATPAFAALPGAPAPDYIFPAGSVPFFSIGGDTIRYVPYDVRTFGAGVLPTDGIHSLNKLLVSQVNSPTNYAGATGSIDVSPGPTTVPDGSPGAPMTVAKLDPAGASLSVSWDTALCSGAVGHHIIHGQKSTLPAALGGVYGVSGAACGVGTSSPYAWNPAPESVDGSGLVWWLIVTEKGTKEGGWGRDSAASERNGATSSGQCGMTTKDVSNVCGQ